jgi:hypothetical protein
MNSEAGFAALRNGKVIWKDSYSSRVLIATAAACLLDYTLQINGWSNIDYTLQINGRSKTSENVNMMLIQNQFWSHLSAWMQSRDSFSSSSTQTSSVGFLEKRNTFAPTTAQEDLESVPPVQRKIGKQREELNPVSLLSYLWNRSRLIPSAFSTGSFICRKD